jgi:hypothetical protein
MIFILFVLALAVGFYAYAFVNFQKEIAETRRGKVLGAVTIPLHVQHCRENEAELLSRSSQEFYQVESPYLGPLFLVPRRSKSVNRGVRAAHARLVSVIYGAASGAVHQKSATRDSRAESDSRNVVQITARVSAQR